ncbi:MAG: UPF0755 protein [Alphaproteobacteria bacterium]
MVRIVARLSLALTIILAVLASAAYFYIEDRYTAPGALASTSQLVIEKGSGVRQIAELLHRRGVIADPVIFRLGLRYDGLASGLKAGEFAFPAAVSMREAARLIASGKTVLRRLTIAEGLTTKQVVALVEAAEGLVGTVSGVTVLEGVLLPETYFYSWGDMRAGLIARMRAEMAQAIVRLWGQRDHSITLATPQEAVILASVIEKETGVAAERARISAVFHNRLKRGMRLQSDPTVVYAVAGGAGALGRELTRADLATVSPYNTYQIKGLPPGPIANPGRAAIEAALRPDDGKDLYFVADGSGGHAFARTLDEHNRNVARFRRLQRQRKRAP